MEKNYLDSNVHLCDNEWNLDTKQSACFIAFKLSIEHSVFKKTFELTFPEDKKLKLHKFILINSLNKIEQA